MFREGGQLRRKLGELRADRRYSTDTGELGWIKRRREGFIKVDKERCSRLDISDGDVLTAAGVDVTVVEQEGAEYSQVKHH